MVVLRYRMMMEEEEEEEGRKEGKGKVVIGCEGCGGGGCCSSVR